MKGFKLFFVVCLGLLVFQATIAADNDDTARAAVRRDAAATSGARQKSSTTTPQSKQTSRGGGRANVATASSVRERTATRNSGRTTSTPNTTPRSTTTRTVSERNQTTTNLAPRSPGTATTTTARTAARTATNSTRAATTRGASKQKNTRKSRAATSVGITGAISANYTACRKIYYDCMDEFCANKNSQLRRCACSSRATEFNGAQKQLSRIEEKMLDFNQRLLTVNLDAEDVNAMMTSSVGEDAYYDTTDKTKSKKMLDDISKRLNRTFGEEATTGMGAISLSLNTDSVFDSIDSFGGIDTTSKNGVELYRAALPVCREMVLETCSAEELSLAESGYQMQIEQDCNTVAKSYQSQTEQARAKVLESSALLDMSRLDAHQKRNSDDVLTCKKKMLDMLTDTTVCGDKMSKCLDITGQYIDPATGKAFLTENLSNLSSLITRPGAGETWTKISANSTFVKFIEDKKDYLKPAMEKCQDIADTVWDEFLPDALAQIKLAQDAKLEEVRQACTTLVSECLVDANDSITNFDARALSVFGVSADLTANTMCAKVKNACTTLLNSDVAPDETSTNEWGTGIADITTQKTYETILSSCNQVGRNCIIQTCKSVSGNFGLCNSITTSPNRHSILTRTACWNEVMQCVADAGDESIRNIMKLLGKDTAGTAFFYNDIYNDGYIPEADWPVWSIGSQILDDLCRTECAAETETDFDVIKCGKCRLTERIWGNCESNPSQGATSGTNYILKPDGGLETLLYWFATSTGTATDKRACTNLRCNRRMSVPGETGAAEACADSENSANITTDSRYCPAQPNYNTNSLQPEDVPNWFGDNHPTNDDWLYTPMDNENYYYSANNYPGTYFFRMFDNTGNTKCCWSRPTKQESPWILNISQPGEMYLGNNTCCRGEPKEVWGNAAQLTGLKGYCLPSGVWKFKNLGWRNNQVIVCATSMENDSQENSFYCEENNSCTSHAYDTQAGNFPHGENVYCDGTFILIDTSSSPHTYKILKNGTATSRNGFTYKKYCPSDTSDGFIEYETNPSSCNQVLIQN